MIKSLTILAISCFSLSANAVIAPDYTGASSIEYSRVNPNICGIKLLGGNSGEDNVYVGFGSSTTDYLNADVYKPGRIDLKINNSSGNTTFKVASVSVPPSLKYKDSGGNYVPLEEDMVVVHFGAEIEPVISHSGYSFSKNRPLTERTAVLNKQLFLMATFSDMKGSLGSVDFLNSSSYLDANELIGGVFNIAVTIEIDC